MVAIKDFGMPKNCYECDLHNYHFCDLTGNLVEQNIDDCTTAADCPLVEIKENEDATS